MINLEGFEIEEMRSINHIMTVELQFDKPVTQAEAQNYLFRVLARANEMEAQNEKEICKKIFNADGIISKSALAAAFGVPESELNIDARETYPAADMDPINTTAKRTFEETANKSPEIADENPEFVNKETENANDEAFDAAVRAEFQKAKKPEKTKGKPGPKRGKIDWDKACALKKAGWSNDAIATEVHTTVGTINSMIYKRLEEYNAGKRSERMEEIEE